MYSCHQKATRYNIYYWEPIQIKDCTKKQNMQATEESADEKDNDLFLSVHQF